jgi:hypothetical protein
LLTLWRTVLVATAIATLITAGTQQAAGDIASGLVAHWRLDETNGTTACDSTVNHYDATLYNTPTLGEPGATPWHAGAFA